MPKPRFNFTLKAIDAIPAPAAKRALYRDTQEPKLGLMVQPTGHKSYFWFQKVNGQPVWRTIGRVADLSLEQARDAAHQLSNDCVVWKLAKYKGDNPFSGRRDELTFAAAVDEYVKRRVPKLKNPDHAELRLRQQIKRDLPAAWSKRRLSDISRRDVADLHNELGTTRRATANAAVRTIRKVYSCAIKAELYRGDNPGARPDLFPLPCRKRFLQRDEVWQFFEALKTEPNPDMTDFAILAVLTGARKVGRAVRCAGRTFRSTATIVGRYPTLRIVNPTPCRLRLKR